MHPFPLHLQLVCLYVQIFWHFPLFYISIYFICSTHSSFCYFLHPFCLNHSICSFLLSKHFVFQCLSPKLFYPSFVLFSLFNTRLSFYFLLPFTKIILFVHFFCLSISSFNVSFHNSFDSLCSSLQQFCLYLSLCLKIFLLMSLLSTPSVVASICSTLLFLPSTVLSLSVSFVG